MCRLAILCCAVLSLGSLCTAAQADDATRQELRRAALAKRGLLEFDVDGNGILDAKERAAAVAARRAGASDDVQTYSAIGVPTSGASPSQASLADSALNPNSGGNAFAAKRGFDYATPTGYRYKSPGVFESPEPIQPRFYMRLRNRRLGTLWERQGTFSVAP